VSEKALTLPAHHPGRATDVPFLDLPFASRGARRGRDDMGRIAELDGHLRGRLRG